MLRSTLLYRFLAAAVGAVAGVLLTIGAMTAWGMPGYFLGVFVLVPAILLIASGPSWQVPEVLAAAAGTLFGPGLAFAAGTLFSVVRGYESLGMVPTVVMVTALYFTGLGTLIGVLVATVLGTSRNPSTPNSAAKP